MRLTGDTVHFRSTYEWFRTERAGEKPNTVRIMDEADYEALRGEAPRRITITCVDPTPISTYGAEAREFTRPVTGVFRLGELFGKTVVMICWRQP